MSLNLDASLENADWTKQTWDLPVETEAELDAYLKASGISREHFETLPCASAAPWRAVIAAAKKPKTYADTLAMIEDSKKSYVERMAKADELIGDIKSQKRYPKGTEVAPGGKGPGGGRFAPVNAPAPGDISPDLDEMSEPDAGWMVPDVLQNINALQGHRERVKSEVVANLADRLDLDPEWDYAALETFDPLWKWYSWHDYDEQGVGSHLAIDALVQTWTHSSSDSNISSLLLQQAVADEFGLPWDLTAITGEEVIGGYQDKIRDAPADVKASMRAFVRAQYAETQAYLKAQESAAFLKLSEARGDKEPHYTLYRGMSFNALEMPFEAGMSETDFDMNAASSWALDFEQARRFSYPSEDGMSQYETPALLAARIPRSRILATPITGMGCLPETEVVVIGAGHDEHDRAVVWGGKPGEEMDVYDTESFREELEQMAKPKSKRKPRAKKPKIVADTGYTQEQLEVAEALGEDPEDMYG